MTLVKALGTLLLCCSIIGCASQPEQPQWVQQTGDAQSPSRNLQVQTTQGSTNITPTVVSYAPEQIDDPLESFNRGGFRVQPWSLYLCPQSVGQGLPIYYA